jgi:hypothetical protein
LKSLKQGVSRRLIDNPLKPKDGLSGPPSSKPGLNGPPSSTSGLNGLPSSTSRLGGPPQHPIPPARHFWKKRYYDFNIRDYAQFVEKLRYIHRNPVKAGLCERPEDWPWSSFLHYATGVEGRVEIESEWTARKRERAAGGLCAAVELPHSSQKMA